MCFFPEKARFGAFLAVLCLLAASVSAQIPQPAGFNFIVFGDMPYTLPADYARFENLIRDVNAQKSQVFNVHVGDITRLQVFGENNMHAVRVFIDPTAPGLFRIEQLMIGGN